MRRMWQLLVGTVLAATVALAGAADLVAGDYVFGAGFGSLSIASPAKAGAAPKVAIDVLGANCHLCAMTGTLKGNRIIADEASDKLRCSLTIKAKGKTLSVSSDNEACREFCGARASMDGEYTMPPASCTPAAQAQRRKDYMTLYTAKKHADAAVAIEGLLAECRPFMHFSELGRTQNDLALSYHHAGQSAKCLSTLDQVDLGDAKNDEDIRNRWPPCEADMMLKVAKSTWFNQKLCRK